jgi:1,4-dihydroxy-2-naphthoate octaprenyltransferase
VRIGDQNARRVYVALLALAHLAAVATLIPTTLLTLLALPMSLSISRQVLSGISGKDLIPVLGKTAKLRDDLFYLACYWVRDTLNPCQK